MIVQLLIAHFVLNKFLIPLQTMAFIVQCMPSMMKEDANHNKSHKNTIISFYMHRYIIFDMYVHQYGFVFKLPFF